MAADPDDGTCPDRAVDGRSAIRDRNRDAVLDAVLDLFSEDNLSPGPEEVAERAGLSVRSVYRYFDDHDALSRAAIERQLERVGPLLLLPAIGEGELDDRIGRFVESRLRLQAAAGPALRATRIRATSIPSCATSSRRTVPVCAGRSSGSSPPSCRPWTRAGRGHGWPRSTPCRPSSPSTTTSSTGDWPRPRRRTSWPTPSVPC